MNKNVLVIGAGQVGAQIVQQGIAKNITANFFLNDINKERCKAHILDLKDTLLFSQNTQIDTIDLDSPNIAHMDVVVINAGANQEPGESRCDLLNKNAELLANLAKQLKTLPQHCVVILITNPVDIITKFAQQLLHLPANQIIGTGTLLDSARLKWRLAEQSKISTSNIHGYVLGEHGDSEFVAWSTVSAFVKLSEEEKLEIEKLVRTEAYEIIQGKGATYFGIAGATVKLLNAVVNDTREVLPVSTSSTHFSKSHLHETPIGIPAVIGKNGVESLLPLTLSEQEFSKLEQSAEKLYTLYQET